MNSQKFENRRVVVSGGAGFLGSHLVDQLLASGAAEVIVVDNFFLGAEANLVSALSTGRVKIIRMDATNLSAMQDIICGQKIDTFFDLAVIPLPTSLSYPEWTIMTNIAITTTACELARLGCFRRLVHCSSSEVYGSARYVPMDENHPHEPITPYAASKSGADRIVDSYVKTFRVLASTVRPFNNFGPRQNIGMYAGIIPTVVKRVLTGLPIEIHGDGEQTRDLTFVRDTAEQIVQIAASDSLISSHVNIASGVETSINSLVAQILEILGTPRYPIIHVLDRPGDVRRHLADTSRIQSLTGQPAKRFSQLDLAETIDWYRRALQ